MKSSFPWIAGAVGLLLTSAMVIQSAFALSTPAGMNTAEGMWMQECRDTFGSSSMLCDMNASLSPWMRPQRNVSRQQMQMLFRRWMTLMNKNFNEWLKEQGTGIGGSMGSSSSYMMPPTSGNLPPIVQASQACKDVRGRSRMRCIDDQLRIWESRNSSSSSYMMSSSSSSRSSSSLSSSSMSSSSMMSSSVSSSSSL